MLARFPVRTRFGRGPALRGWAIRLQCTAIPTWWVLPGRSYVSVFSTLRAFSAASPVRVGRLWRLLPDESGRLPIALSRSQAPAGGWRLLCVADGPDALPTWALRWALGGTPEALVLVEVNGVGPSARAAAALQALLPIRTNGRRARVVRGEWAALRALPDDVASGLVVTAGQESGAAADGPWTGVLDVCGLLPPMALRAMVAGGAWVVQILPDRSVRRAALADEMAADAETRWVVASRDTDVWDDLRAWDADGLAAIRESLVGNLWCVGRRGRWTLAPPEAVWRDGP